MKCKVMQKYIFFFKSHLFIPIFFFLQYRLRIISENQNLKTYIKNMRFFGNWSGITSMWLPVLLYVRTHGSYIRFFSNQWYISTHTYMKYLPSYRNIFKSLCILERHSGRTSRASLLVDKKQSNLYQAKQSYSSGYYRLMYN